MLFNSKKLCGFWGFWSVYFKQKNKADQSQFAMNRAAGGAWMVRLERS